MPVSPDDGARLTQRIAELYADAELALLTLISSSLVRGIDAPDWAMVKLGELRLIRGRVERELAALDVAAAVAVRSIIDRAYTTGAAQAVGDLNRAGLTADTLPPALSYAVGRLARETLANLAQARPMALRSTLDIYQRTVADATGTILTGAQTRIQAAQQALDRWASRGITGFRDQAGRNWSLESYAEMAVRSAAGRAAVLGHVEHLQASGLDLVIVSYSPRRCPLCAPYEGKVLSLSGSVAGSITAPSALDGQPTTVTVYSSLADAHANGLFHPNCRHRLGLFLPGATAETGTANPAGYAAEQRQRAIERTIRQWKQRQATALDDTANLAAGRKVRAWQAQMRDFLDANPDLRRKYSREQIGQAH